MHAFLAEENKAHLSSIANEVQKALVYGRIADGLGRFDGLATYYDSVSSTTKASARNVIDAGGKGESLTSIWVVTPGEYLTRLFHPAGTVEGLEMKDDGEIAYSPPGFYRTFIYKVGLAVHDWRANARIANIDPTSDAVNLPELVDKALDVLKRNYPPGDTIQRYIYMSQRVQEIFLMQATAMGAHDLLRTENVGGEPSPGRLYAGNPIRVLDALGASTEDQVQ